MRWQSWVLERCCDCCMIISIFKFLYSISYYLFSFVSGICIFDSLCDLRLFSVSRINSSFNNCSFICDKLLLLAVSGNRKRKQKSFIKYNYFYSWCNKTQETYDFRKRTNKKKNYISILNNNMWLYKYYYSNHCDYKIWYLLLQLCELQ